MHCPISFLLLASRARVALYGLGSKSKSAEFFAAPAARLQAVSPSRTPMTPLNAPLQLRCTVVKHGVLCLAATLSPRRPSLAGSPPSCTPMTLLGAPVQLCCTAVARR
ncbi:hypothetical protein C8R45DRAFT_1099926 [Mycena sanguinolenta]|nr:hypothetical protein C8R45DRAFT_1099926 [Mycena sanguinolenta]